jgi:putative tryptophan/tyrosine transport system substrate-binding protein
MRRRQFITVLGGTAATWPLAARAQQPAMPAIGFLNIASLESVREYLAGFHSGLSDTGYVEGRNVEIEYLWAHGQNDQLPALVDELVRHQVSVIVVLASTNGALAAKAATQTIPIVFAQAADPVRIGLVSSLNRPGGNVTGINLFLVEVAAKRFQQLMELVPKAKTIAHLSNPSNPVFAETEKKEVEAAAHVLGLHLLVVNARRPSEIDAAFTTLAEGKAAGVLVAGDGFFFIALGPNCYIGEPLCGPCNVSAARIRICGRSHQLWNEHC